MIQGQFDFMTLKKYQNLFHNNFYNIINING